MFDKLPETAKALGLSEYSLRKMVRKGLCPAIMIGGKYYLEIEKVKHFLHQQSLLNLQPKSSQELTD